MWWAKIGMLVNLGLRKVEGKRFKVLGLYQGMKKIGLEGKYRLNLITSDCQVC